MCPYRPSPSPVAAAVLARRTGVTAVNNDYSRVKLLGPQPIARPGTTQFGEHLFRPSHVVHPSHARRLPKRRTCNDGRPACAGRRSRRYEAGGRSLCHCDADRESALITTNGSDFRLLVLNTCLRGFVRSLYSKELVRTRFCETHAAYSLEDILSSFCLE